MCEVRDLDSYQPTGCEVVSGIDEEPVSLVIDLMKPEGYLPEGHDWHLKEMPGTKRLEWVPLPIKVEKVSA